MSKIGPQVAQYLSLPIASLAHQGTSIAYLSTHSSTWILDSGASDHMTGMPDIFSSLQQSSTHTHVTVANGSHAIVNGIGTVIISPTITLSSVLYVPSFPFNLISIKKLIIDLHISCSVFFLFCHYSEYGDEGTDWRRAWRASSFISNVKVYGSQSLESSVPRMWNLSTRKTSLCQF